MKAAVVSDRTKILNDLWNKPILKCTSRQRTHNVHACPFAYQSTPMGISTICALPKCEPNLKKPSPKKPGKNACKRKKVARG